MSKPRISIIAIISKNRGLGKDNKLLFHIPGELSQFKKITMGNSEVGHAIIMGRKTFESIGRPHGLPNRYNIIVSHNSSFNQKGEFSGCMFVTSLDLALKEAKEYEMKREGEDEKEIFIIGGGQIYQQAMLIADRLYLTVVDKEADADTFFSDYSAFTKVISKEERNDWEYPYAFWVLEK